MVCGCVWLILDNSLVLDPVLDQFNFNIYIRSMSPVSILNLARRWN